MFLIKVLLVTEKCCGGNPNLGLSTGDSLLLGTLKQIGLIQNIESFYYDIIGLTDGIDRMSQILIETCEAFAPDLVVFSPMEESFDPNKDAIGYIKDTLRIPVAGYFYDSVQRYPFVKGWLPFLTKAVVIDSSVGWYRLSRGDDKVLLGFTSVNQQHFYDRKLTKDIDVLFIGTLTSNGGRWPHRKEYMDFLSENRVSLTVTGGQQTGSVLTTDEYASMISRSKISINFSQILPGLDQVKGRVFETMASNTFLLEEKGMETGLFLEDGKDYISFSSKVELLEKVRYYLENPDIREQLTISGYEKVSAVYNPLNFWAYVFCELGFDMPKRIRQSDGYNQLVGKLKFIQSQMEKAHENIHIRDYPRVAIFGASKTGEEYLRECRQQGVEVKFFLDNYDHNKSLGGLPVLPISSVNIEEIEQNIDAIILASAGHFIEMKNQLIRAGFNKKIIEYFC